MKTKAAYLVIDAQRKTIVRTTMRWPTLYPGEFTVRITLDISDELIPTGVYELECGDPDAIGVGIETVAVDPPEEAVA